MERIGRMEVINAAGTSKNLTQLTEVHHYLEMKPGFVAMAFVAINLSAQEDSVRSATLAGLVLDSLHNQPLADATISIQATGIATRTDSLGRFSINVPPGRYDVLASHPIADSLGILLVARGLNVTSGSNAQILLALPSQATTRRMICPDADLQSDKGFIRGRVMRSDRLEAARDVKVTLSWLQLSLTPNVQSAVTYAEAVTSTDAQGYYAFCSLPEDFEGSIRASRGADSTGLITVSLAGKPFGMGLRSLLLPTGRSGGTFSGRVTDSTGRALNGVIIEIVGKGTSASTRSDGTFKITNSPLGTQMARARKLGYRSQLFEVDVASPTQGRVHVTLDNPLPQLVDVVVREMRSEVADRTGFSRRAYAGPGRYMTAKDLEKNRFHCILVGLKFAVPRGSDMCSLGTRHTSMMGFRGVSTLQGLQPGTSGERVQQQSPSSASTDCLKVYIDDQEERPRTDGIILLGWLDPKEVVGIEYYTAASSPARLMSGQCQVILIWTIWYRGSHH